MEAVWKRATADALAYEKGGADALIIENYGDVPFTPGRVPAETVAAMSAVGVYLREVAGVSLPLGYNVLRNDPASALGLAAVSRGRFVRVNVHSGAMVTDQGVIEGRAFETVRLRQRLSPEVAIWADVHVKHAQPLGEGIWWTRRETPFREAWPMVSSCPGWRPVLPWLSRICSGSARPARTFFCWWVRGRTLPGLPRCWSLRMVSLWGPA